MHRPEPLPDPLESSRTGSLGLSASPIIVRLAGLPAQALEPLRSLPCLALLQAREPLEAELEEARRSIVAAIGEVLTQFNTATRRFLLTVKRQCFNGRELGIYRRKAGWDELLRVSPNLAEHIVSLEEQLFENDRAFTALYEHELTRERQHILNLIQDRRFLRGVALGRPGLVQKARERAPSLSVLGALKKPEKWEQSLLRFVTRAAAKLSANSTLTTYALGSIQEPASSLGFRFNGSPQREVSLVRVNRPELEQFQTLLMRHPTVRERALVGWNDSLEEIEPGKYRFLREGHWSVDAGEESFLFVPPTRIRVALSNPIFDATREILREGPVRYGTLLDRLGTPLNRKDLDELIDLGLLILMPPWPTYEAHLERRIAQFLRALPDELTLRAAADGLDELLALEEGFSSAPRPESSVVDMEAAFTRVLTSVSHLSGHERTLHTQPHFFEEVLFEAEKPADDRGVFQVDAPVIQRILQSAGMVSRFAGLFNHRHDVLHTLAAWWKEHEPGRCEIPFTEVAQRFSPLWKQFIHFHKTANVSALNTFNPLRAAAIEALLERRQTLLSQYKTMVSRSPSKDILSPQQLQDLVQFLPSRYAPLFGSCAFVQPVDPKGTSWVLNHLHEGTGRYLSRVTPILEGPLRQRFLDHLIARSVVSLEGEEAELLEVMHPWGNLVNAHAPQASKVLDVRGLHLDLPRERRIALSELKIQADLDSETFRLTDSCGRRLLPVNLSTLADIWHPNLLRFLLMFGPSEIRGVFPSAYAEGNEDLRCSGRLTCGRLVLCRQRWVIRIEKLREALEGLTDPQAYSYVHEWRSRLGLPTIGFYNERTHLGRFKPQFVDFGSPSLCRLFVTSIGKMTTKHLIFEEALPSPADFPADASLTQRGLEILIDSFAIRTVRGNPPVMVPSHDRETISLRKE